MTTMRRNWMVLFAVLLLVAPLGVLGAGAQEDNEDDADDDRSDARADADRRAARGADSNDGTEADDEDDDADGDDHRDRLRDARRGPDRPLGHLEVDGTNIDGRFVFFDVSETLPGITGYGVRWWNNTTIFASIALPAASDPEWNAHGAQFAMRGHDAMIHALDTPNAVLMFGARNNSNIVATLAPGVTAALHAPPADDDEADDDDAEDADDADDDDKAENHRALYVLTLPGGHTALLGGHDIAFDGASAFTIGGKAQFRLARPELGHDDKDEDDEHGPGDRDERRARAHELRPHLRDEVEQAIADGRIAVEVFADADGGDPVAFELGHVKVRGAHAPRGGPVRASLEVEAPDGSPGAIIVLNLDPEDLGHLTVTEAADQLAVRFDGAEIEPADDLADIMHWNDDDGASEYLLLVGKEKVQVLVSIAHFSPHTVEVFETQSAGYAEIADGAPLPAMLAVIAGAVAALALVRRRQD